MSAHRKLLTSRETADRLGKSLDWLYRNRKGLEALGFPGTVPGCGSYYDPRAIDAWLDAQMPAPLRAIANRETTIGGAGGAQLVDVEGWQAELDRRSAGLGKSH